jgi:hypothetical protein
MNKAGVRRFSVPVAASGPTRAAIMAAVTAAVAPSGPAIMKGMELRAATTAAPVAVAMKVAAIP